MAVPAVPAAQALDASENRTGVSAMELEALFRQHSTTLWRTLFAYTGGHAQAAEEAVAEAFTRALEHRSTIREPLPWIYRTAFRIASAEARRRHAPAGGEDIVAPQSAGRLGELIEAL